MIFLGGTSGFHYGQVVLQIHLSVGQVDFLTKFDPCYTVKNQSTLHSVLSTCDLLLSHSMHVA